MEWIKAFHVIAIIAWMAGTLYLPRLFVYHVDAEPGSAQSETFKVMERRLFRAIMTPAMIASWVFGLWMIIGYQIIDWSQGWVWLKAVLVIALSGYHGLMARHLKDLAADRNTKSARYFRFMNEAPTLMMIGIVIAVIARPF